jgi:hypothetical protein
VAEPDFEALAAEAEAGYDITSLLEHKAEGWVYAALCSWANRAGPTIHCGKDKNVITIYDGPTPLARVTVE